MSEMLTANYFVWGVFPYICLTLFFVVPFLRMIYRPFGLTTRASGIFRGRDTLGLAAHLLHWGIFLAFFGHLAGLAGGVMGLGGWVSAFYLIATAGGVAAIVGSIIALVRRIRVPEMRAMSQTDDYVVHLFLIAILGVAIYQANVDRIWGVAFTAAPWFASLWRFQPQPELMDSAPLLSKIHVLLAFTFAAYFPFTKLIHAWTLPVNYFVRPYQVLRTQALKFRDSWEFGLVTDKSYMTYVASAVVLLMIGIGFTLPGPSGSSLATPALATNAALDDPAAAPVRPVLTGYPLYVSQCARCHGLDGGGDGPGAKSPTFANPPRNLAAGRFRYVSTDNGVASDGDLRRVIAHGLAGSGMPAFGSLSAAQVDSLVDVVGHLWARRPDAGAPIAVPPRPATTEAVIKSGKEQYDAYCASCHGASGLGDGEAGAAIVDTTGHRVRPRNLVAQELRGVRTPEDLYVRIVAGVPEGPDQWLMPQFLVLEPEEVWAIVSYLEKEVIPAHRLAAANRAR